MFPVALKATRRGLPPTLIVPLSASLEIDDLHDACVRLREIGMVIVRGHCSAETAGGQWKRRDQRARRNVEERDEAALVDDVQFGAGCR